MCGTIGLFMNNNPVDFLETRVLVYFCASAYAKATGVHICQETIIISMTSLVFTPQAYPT